MNTVESSAVVSPVEPAALLSVKGTASILNVSPSHVYRLADAGRMPRPVRLGALVRWKRSELDAWISEGCKPVRSMMKGN